MIQFPPMYCPCSRCRIPRVGETISTIEKPTAAFLDYVLSQAQVTTNVCSFQAGTSGYTLELRTVSDYNYIFVREGTLVWVVEDVPHELSAGDLIVVPPGIKHHAHSITRVFTLGSIHVELRLPGGQDVFDLLVPPRVRHVAPDTMLDRYLAGTVTEWSRPDKSETMLAMPSWARLVSLELIRHDAAAGTLRQRPIDPLVVAVLEELNQRIEEPVTLDDLAHLSGFTPQHLNRVFRRVLGTTPLQYLARMRMERAAVMLADGRWTVRAIAKKVGFDDPYYFSRQFKSHFGRSPAQYREALGPNAALTSD